MAYHPIHCQVPPWYINENLNQNKNEDLKQHTFEFD